MKFSARKLILFFQKTNNNICESCCKEDMEEFGNFQNRSPEYIYDIAFEAGVVTAAQRLSNMSEEELKQVLNEK